jgi:methylmalonyl-CoA mutase N-terminal domain/subunit
MRQRRVEEVIAFKNSRDYSKLGPRLAKLHQDAKDGVNISAAVIEAVKEGMTLGEMCGVVRLGYGLGYDPMDALETPDYVVKALKEGR